jgi:pimeloyl-ACP methyl ester carboxylesterase
MERRETRTWTGRDGLRLVGDVRGPVDGQLIVLLHGDGQTRHSWWGIGDRLAHFGYRVVTFDARGHGCSGWSDSDGYELESFASDLLALVESLGASNPVLVGSSLGGRTGLVATGELGMPASSVVLADGLPQTEASHVTRLALLVEGCVERKLDGRDSQCPEAVAANTRGIDFRSEWHCDPKLASRKPDLDREQQRLNAALGATNSPVMLIRSMPTDVFADDDVAKFKTIRPDAECLTVRNTAHMVAADQDNLFTVAVAEFLLRSSPSRATS